MANNTRGAILFDVFGDAQDILRAAGHPRRTVQSDTLRTNLRKVITEDFNYDFTQYSVYSQPNVSLAQAQVDARAIKRMGPPAHPANDRRNMTWLQLVNPPAASLACAEIRLV